MEFPVLETEKTFYGSLPLMIPEDLFEYFSQDQVMEYYDLAPLKHWKIRKIIQHSIASLKKERIPLGPGIKIRKKVIGTCGYHNWYRRTLQSRNRL
jgi:ribosomal-protein-alanine N-acetyltransferase